MLSRPINASFTLKINKESIAWFVGFAVNSKITEDSVVITVPIDEQDALEAVTTLLREEHPVKQSKKTATLTIQSKSLAKSLTKIYGATETQFRLLPKVRENLRRHMFRGLFDSSGTMSVKERHFRISLRSYPQHVSSFVSWTRLVPPFSNREVVFNDRRALDVAENMYGECIYFVQKKRDVYKEAKKIRF